MLHDTSKNPYYKASLNSQKNIDFILRHADYADLIGDVLIKLHEAMIGKAYQEQAETYMAMMMDKKPDIFLQFSEMFLRNSNIALDPLKRTLSEAQFYDVIQQIIDQAPARTPARKPG